MKNWIFWQIFSKYLNIKFRKNPSSGSRVVPQDRRTDRYMTRLIVTFLNFPKAPKVFRLFYTADYAFIDVEFAGNKPCAAKVKWCNCFQTWLKFIKRIFPRDISVGYHIQLTARCDVFLEKLVGAELAKFSTHVVESKTFEFFYKVMKGKFSVF